MGRSGWKRGKRGKRKTKLAAREEGSGENGTVNQAQLSGASAKASKTVKAAKDMEKRAKKAGRRSRNSGNSKPKEERKRTEKGLSIASKPGFRSSSGVIVRLSSGPDEEAKEDTDTEGVMVEDNAVDGAALPKPEVRVVQIFDELRNLNAELEKLPYEIFQRQNVQMLKGVIRSLDKDWKRFVESSKASRQSAAKPQDSEPNPRKVSTPENDCTSNFSASVVSREESTSSRNHPKGEAESDPFDISRVEDNQSLGSDSSYVESSNEQDLTQLICSGPTASIDRGSGSLNGPIQGKSGKMEEFSKTGMWTPQFEIPKSSPRALGEPTEAKPSVVPCKARVCFTA
mmetsp:Transcript_6996/g.10340  ORF Transcript_6996/g.10340 Transcript_6996/m.10340 type:complete len:343 (-) Transcript_6996:254-1282(-)